MNLLNTTKYPTIDDVVTKINSLIDFTIGEIMIDESETVLTSHIVGTNSEDSYSCSISFALKDNPYNHRVLNFFIVQNINTTYICVIISSGEENGLKILFDSINKYPSASLEKYLPSIVKSTVNILKKTK